MRRVVVTGLGAISPLGGSLEETLAAVSRQESGVRYISEWDEYRGLKTRLGAPVESPVRLGRDNSKALRSMGRAAILATAASEQALEQAGLEDPALFASGRMGIAYGSGTGSTAALTEVCNFLFNKNTRGITGTTYHRMMSHTCAANLGIYFQIRGRVLPTSSACTSGSLGIGYAYEQIKGGHQDVMLAGGAEEFAAPIAAIFDTLYACSLKNDSPEATPRPFDAQRDGLVIGEGACSFVLESLEHAMSRGAKPLAELVGFGTTSDGHHITAPLEETIQSAIELALADASLSPEAIDCINAHATGTDIGDVVESLATAAVFSRGVPISSLKGHLGHLLGASGAVEAALSIAMLNAGWLNPTRNFENLDARCADLDYVQGEARRIEAEYVMSNTFAFGGINTSLIFKRME